MDSIKREELASQVLAVIQAVFSRPKYPEIEEVLESAKRQAKAICPQELS